jgi:hypothetical protein
MAKFKVKTPNENFNGQRHGVQFSKGEAIAELETNIVKEFESWGYVVEEIKEKKEAPKKPSTKKAQTNKK